MAAIMVQRGMRKQVIRMLHQRKEHFLAGMQQDLPRYIRKQHESPDGLLCQFRPAHRHCGWFTREFGIWGTGWANVVRILDGDLPTFLDFEHYVT